MKTFPKPLSPFRQQGAFTMVEILTVLAIMVILLGLSSRMFKPGGQRGGAISQVMGALEEARMTAIEKGGKIYFGIAGADHPDPTKRYRAYILYRDQTTEERQAELEKDPEASSDRKIAITKWEILPQGFYFDPETLKNISDAIPVAGLPGNPLTVHAVGFGALGQVETAPNGAGRLEVNVVRGVFQESDNTVINPPSEQGSNFNVAVYGLTGRVRLSPPALPAVASTNP